MFGYDRMFTNVEFDIGSMFFDRELFNYILVYPVYDELQSEHYRIFAIGVKWLLVVLDHEGKRITRFLSDGYLMFFKDPDEFAI